MQLARTPSLQNEIVQFQVPCVSIKCQKMISLLMDMQKGSSILTAY